MTTHPWADVLKLVENARSNGKKIVSTNGCFDILHKGHVSYLEESKSLGDFLIVAINADKSVRAIKGPERPINNEDDRAFVLSALKHVDAVVIFEENTPEEFLRQFKPEIHVKGADWKDKNIPEESIMKDWNGSVHYAGFVDGYSTTKIIEKSKTPAQS